MAFLIIDTFSLSSLYLSHWQVLGGENSLPQCCAISERDITNNCGKYNNNFQRSIEWQRAADVLVQDNYTLHTDNYKLC